MACKQVVGTSYMVIIMSLIFGYYDTIITIYEVSTKQMEQTKEPADSDTRFKQD